MSADGAPPRRTVASRLTSILLTFCSGGVHSLTEIAALTGLPMSTTHRMTVELASWQLLQRLPDGRYAVGPNLRRMAGDVACVARLDERAALVVTDLCETTRRRARLGILSGGGHLCYAEKHWGEEPPTRLDAGATLPAHATALGKALLAFASRARVLGAQQRMAAFTTRTVTDPEKLHRQLHIVRLTGLAHCRGELVPGDCAVAVPVFGPGGQAVAALELQVQDRRADVEMCRATLIVAARGLSRELSLGDEAHERPHLRLLPGPAGNSDARSRRLQANGSGDAVARQAADGDRGSTVPLAVRGLSHGT